MLAGRAQRVERRGPARVGLRAPVERRETSRRGCPCSSVVSASGSAPSSSSEQERASRNGAGSKPDPVARRLEQGPAALDLRLQIVLALARGLELLLGDALRLRVEVGLPRSRARAARRRGGGCPAEPALDVVVDDLREAAELLLDRLGLPDEHLEDAVLDALRQDEVVAADLVGRLELAVDAAVALLDAAGVPGQVEVEQVGAVGLEVQALAGGVGGEQDAQRILRRVGVEPALDLLAPRAAREAVDHLDALVGAVGALDRLLEDRLQVALRALAVLGEDQDAAVVPLRRRALRRLAEGREVRAEVLADPVDQPADLGVGQVPRSARRSPASGRAAPARGATALPPRRRGATRPRRPR